MSRMDLSEANIGAADLLGDPLGLAEYQYRLASQLCGPCRDYHALWPYRRLAGIVSGVEPDAPVLEPALREATPRNGHVLIAGAADAGMLGLVVRATERATPAIAVADRCATPLAVCRRYAESRGLSVATHLLDLAAIARAEHFDVVFAHGFIQFIPEEARVAYLRSLGGMLNPGGTVVIAERLRVKAGHEPRQGDYTNELIATLRAEGIPLPEREDAFRQRLEREVAALRERIAGALGPDDLGACFAAAGFHVTARTNLERRRTVTVRNGGSETVTMQIVVARPAGRSSAFAPLPEDDPSRRSP